MISPCLHGIRASACGKYGHSKGECWTIKGYPPGYPKPQSQKGKEKETGNVNHPTGPPRRRGGRWNRGGRFDRGGITMKQIEQMLKQISSTSKAGGEDSDDELDGSYSGMVISCHYADNHGEGMKEWIMDLGASDHMTGMCELMSKSESRQQINMPTGETTPISHVGNVRLKNDLELKNVMYVPQFKHNLLLVQKLTRDTGCKVEFKPGYCVIVEEDLGNVRGIGKEKGGIYYLVNKDLTSMKYGVRIVNEIASEKKKRKE
ncbi:Retrovirus-related Pol polyprotein from transposon RE1 [Bienertia sinuspersici]